MKLSHACAHMTAPGSRCQSPSSYYADGKAWCRNHKPSHAIKWWKHLELQKAAQTSAAAVAERTCPDCGAPLEERRCRQVCKKCGYFDDCSIGPA